MLEPRIRLALIITGFTIASGVFDALAFTHSARMWQGERLVWGEAVKAAGSFAIGITIFSGSLYALVATGIRKLGMVTPLGGLTLMAGWASLGWAAWTSMRAG